MAFPAAGERVFANPSMLGVLTSISYEDPDAFRQDIREARKRTDKPIGVNFSLLKEQGLLETYHEAYVRVALEEGIGIVFTSAYDGSAIGRR